MKIREILITGLLGMVAGFLPTKSLANDKVTFCASWIIYGQHAALVAGLERGTFKAQGLDVTLARGHGSGDTFKRVGTGDCDFGDAGTGPAALGRVKGIKAKLIAMWMPRFQEAVFYFAESGIRAMKDLEGKRVSGGPKASSNMLMFPVLARANGIDLGKVKLIYMEPGALPSSLGVGRLDVALAFHTNLPRFQKAAGEAGKKLVVQLWADHGLDLYANGVIASDETIAKRKDLTQRFLRAFYQAHIWGYRNREASVEIFVKKYPEQNPKAALQALDLLFFHFFDTHTTQEGFGRMNPEKMAGTVQITLETSGVKEKLDPSELYTNEFVDRLPREDLFFFQR